jgi:hypothetical protein
MLSGTSSENGREMAPTVRSNIAFNDFGKHAANAGRTDPARVPSRTPPDQRKNT